MTERTKAPRSRCPIDHAIEILGDKWTLLVVRDMVFNHKRSFSQFKAMPEGIATNILTERLARLQRAGVIVRLADPQDGRRTKYELTEHGERMVPLLLELMVWSGRHTREVDAPMALVRRNERDREGAAQEILARLRAAAKTADR
ncbi:MAG: helix-turn-helix domain-containing protein [Pseudomonadota bacterium]